MMPEQVPANLAAAIETSCAVEGQMIELTAQRLRTPDYPNAVIPRGQHPKGHGLVEATFIVRSDIPNEYRVGLFSTPQRFKALIRFSNAINQYDNLPGGHGMAIKLLGTPNGDGTQTHDFLLLDHPVFFAKDAIEFAEFETLLAANKRNWSDPGLIEHLIKHFPQLKILLQIATTRPRNPLHCTYWSLTPYNLRERPVKYVTMPAIREQERFFDIAGKVFDRDCMRHAMVERLAPHRHSDGVTYDFCIQPQMNPATEPIDDATVEWKSIRIKVAAIEIPPQVFDTPGRNAFSENLSFTPWHCHPDHQPLGSLNLARQAVYAKIANYRRTENHVSEQDQAEPTPHTPIP